MKRAPAVALRTLSEHEHALELCTYCPKLCRLACPVSNAEPRETFIPQQKMHALNFLRLGNLPWETEHTAGLYACTGCGHCTDYCAHGNDVAAALFEGRAAAVERGRGHPALADAPRRFAERGDRLAQRVRELLPPERIATEAKVGYLPGCDALEGDGAAFALLDVLERIGVEHVRVPALRNPCGGDPLRAAGQLGELTRHDAVLADELRGFDLVALGCAPCAERLQGLKRAGHLRPEIAHAVQLLAPHVERLPVTRRLPAAYYHDPCYLGRRMGIYDPPRKLLAQVSESVRELAWARGDAFCCGGGGGLPQTMPEVSDEMARRRLAEVAAAGADCLVTACSMCRTTLGAAARRMGGGVRVLDLSEALEESTRPATVAAVRQPCAREAQPAEER